MKVLSMRNVLFGCAIAACLAICIPSFAQSQLAGGIEISHNNTVMLLPVASVADSRIPEKGLTFYIPLKGQDYAALKFEPLQIENHVTVRIFGVISKDEAGKNELISSAKSTLLEAYDFLPKDTEAITAKKSSALAGETISIRFVDAKEAARQLTPPKKISSRETATDPSCQASYVPASFSPRPRLQGMMFAVPIGCAKCGGTTVCPTSGNCIQTACGTVCND